MFAMVKPDLLVQMYINNKIPLFQFQSLNRVLMILLLFQFLRPEVIMDMWLALNLHLGDLVEQ